MTLRFQSFQFASLVLAFFLISCSQDDIITNVVPPSSTLPCGKKIISGYTDKISYFAGDVAQVFIESDSVCRCNVRVFDQAGKVMFNMDAAVTKQIVPSDQPWRYGFNFISPIALNIPADLPSGVYYIENQIPLVIKTQSVTDVTVIYPTNTINAYNSIGGKSLYGFNSTETVAAQTVSFLRPMAADGEQARCNSCLKFFPTISGVKFNYISDEDMEDYASIANSKVLIIAGHSEYWTRKARRNFDQFVSSGKHAIVMSGNTMWWQVRYSAQRDQLMCFRDATVDPETDPLQKTVLWTNSMLQYSIVSSIGADFDHGGYGLKVDSGWDGYKIANGSSPLLEGLHLVRGSIVSMPSDECDGASFTGFDTDGFPILDQQGFHKIELIGYDKGARGGADTYPMFIVFQATTTSGIVINMGANDWCAATGVGHPNGQAKAISKNAIIKLLNNENVFSGSGI
jgi:hypothetical protein